MGIETYDTTASNNTALFPEGMNRSDVNDNLRTVQSHLRTFYNDPCFIQYGDGNGSATSSRMGGGRRRAKRCPTRQALPNPSDKNGHEHDQGRGQDKGKIDAAPWL